MDSSHFIRKETLGLSAGRPLVKEPIQELDERLLVFLIHFGIDQRDPALELQQRRIRLPANR